MIAEHAQMRRFSLDIGTHGIVDRTIANSGVPARIGFIGEGRHTLIYSDRCGKSQIEATSVTRHWLM